MMRTSLLSACCRHIRITSLSRQLLETRFRISVIRSSIHGRPTAGLKKEDEMNKDAREIFDSAVSSVLPHNMVKKALRVKGRTLSVAGKEYDVTQGVHVVAFGKGVIGMLRAAEDVLGDMIVGGVASVPANIQQTFQDVGKLDLLPSKQCKVKIIEGARNNIPDADAFRASQEIAKLLERLKANDVVLTLISGGGSALLPYPIPPITLEEMAALTTLLSRNGASIQELNTVRKHVEVLKGGGLVQAAYPAQMAALILSDVVGDDVAFIASGTTVPNMLPSSYSIEVINKLGLSQLVPPSVMDVLNSKQNAYMAARQSVPLTQFQHKQVQNVLVGTNTIALEAAQHKQVQNVLVGTNTIALETAKQHAASLGYHPVIVKSDLCGDVHEAVNLFSKLISFVARIMYIPRASKEAHMKTTSELELIEMGIPKRDINKLRKAASMARNSKRPVCLLAGGETTVQVKGSGVGGRNQEMALGLAMALQEIAQLEEVEVSPVFLSAGTDGQDGPTVAAGAVVDLNTVTAATDSGLSPLTYLNNNDSFTFFSKLNKGSSHVMTGLTGTNVMDINVILMTPNSDED